MPELWIPGVAGPLDDFVERIHRQIERFARSRGLERVSVEVQLEGGIRLALDSILPEPGYGFVTLSLHTKEDPTLPDEMIVPVGAIRRIELDDAERKKTPFGFSVREGL